MKLVLVFTLLKKNLLLPVNRIFNMMYVYSCHPYGLKSSPLYLPVQRPCNFLNLQTPRPPSMLLAVIYKVFCGFCLIPFVLLIHPFFTRTCVSSSNVDLERIWFFSFISCYLYLFNCFCSGTPLAFKYMY